MSTFVDDAFPEGMVEEISRVLGAGKTEPDGQNLYEGPFASPLMFPLQRRGELRRMMQIARALNPLVVMEIGADKAGGLYHWCRCLPTVDTVVACEIRGLPYRDEFERAFPRIRFLWLPESSRGSAPEGVRQWLSSQGRGALDCLFIDGDKSHFLSDFDAYLPLMNPNGIVFLHDIRDPAPGEAFLSVRARGYRTEAIIDLADTEGALQRRRDGLPAATAHEAWLRHWAGRSCGVGVIYLGEWTPARPEAGEGHPVPSTRLDVQS